MSEWTKISRKKGDTVNFEHGTLIFPSLPDKDATKESILAQLAKHREAWKEDNVRHEIYKILQRLDVFEGPPIVTAVCLALGSLARDNLENSRRSMIQLASFLDIVEHIRSRTGHELAMYAQDPAFLDLDKDVLRSLGFQVLKPDIRPDKVEPAAQYFGSDSFVAEYHMDLSAHQVRIILDSGTRLLHTTVSWHINRLEESHKDRAAGEELRSISDRFYKQYQSPLSQHHDTKAYESMQFFGLVTPDDSG